MPLLHARAPVKGQVARPSVVVFSFRLCVHYFHNFFMLPFYYGWPGRDILCCNYTATSGQYPPSPAGGPPIEQELFPVQQFHPDSIFHPNPPPTTRHSDDDRTPSPVRSPTPIPDDPGAFDNYNLRPRPADFLSASTAPPHFMFPWSIPPVLLARRTCAATQGIDGTKIPCSKTGASAQWQHCVLQWAKGRTLGPARTKTPPRTWPYDAGDPIQRW
jgi:hypothetical protein